MPRKTTPPRIFCVNTLPGVGKTHWIMERLYRFVTTGVGLRPESSPRVYFYVAPTHRLLNQQLNYLRSRLNTDEHRHLIPRLAYVDPQRLTGQRVPRLLAAELQIRNGRINVPRGTVVFMTHEAFEQVPYGSSADSVLADVGVFFDETRQLVVSNGKCQMPLPLFHRVFNYRSVKHTLTGDNTQFYHLSLRDPAITSQTLLQYVKEAVATTRDIERIQRHLLTVVSDTRNPRYESYTSINADAQAVLRKLERDPNHDGSGKWHSFLRVAIPDRLFTGYKETTLASAWLAQSQMYFLLRQAEKRGRVVLEDITDDVELNGRKRKILQRLSRLTLIPLVDDKSALSKVKLNGLLATPSAHAAVQARYPEEGLSPQDKTTLREWMVNDHQRMRLNIADNWSADLRPVIVTMRRFMRQDEFAVQPVAWLVQRAMAVIRDLASKHRDLKLNMHRPLVVVNRSHELLVANTPVAPDSPHTIQDAAQFITSYVHGLNQFTAHRVMVFLSALNPEPVLTRFFNAMYGDAYDFELDFLISTCAQAVARTAIRDVSTDAPVFVVLSDSYIAERLRQHLGGRPILLPSDDVSSMTYYSQASLQPGKRANLTSLNAGERQARSQSQAVSRMTRYHAVVVAALGAEKAIYYKRLGVRLSKAKAKLAADPTNRKAEIRMHALAHEHQALKAKIDATR